MSIRDDLLRAAERRGLVAQGRSASGAIEGRRVSLGFDTAGRNGENVIVRAYLDPPLDLGLTLRERVVASVLEFDDITGHPDLDGEFVITGDEPDRVRTLLHGPLGDATAALYRASFDLRLDDTGCTVYGLMGFMVPDEAWLDHAIDHALELASLMDAQRAALDPAHALVPHAAALQNLAVLRHLAFSTAPLIASGLVEGRPLFIGAKRTGRRRHHLLARAAIEGDLGIGLSIRRQSLLDDIRMLVGGVDVSVGDAAFDKRFLVQATPERAGLVGLLLDTQVRAALLAVDARCGPVTLDDHGIHVEPIPMDHPVEDLVWLADTLTEVTGRVSRNLVRGGAEAGPYR
ncbi:Hypothetical protein A7982_08784 [Minicystis rosea]|nr:Hypothetical protein A7982_08784 [Minicystis rosea]